MSKELLTVSNLKKHYQKKAKVVKALDGVSFSIFKGEKVGIIGESGCGKTTLVNLLSLLLKGDEGKIKYNNIDYFDSNEDGFCFSKKEIDEYRKKVQIIFQNPASSLNPKRLIINTIKEGIRKHHEITKYAVTEDAKEILRKCGIQDKDFYKTPNELSGGQKQRVAIARSLGVSPELFICDEPLSALDKVTKKYILDLLNELWENDDLTFLFISHDLKAVENFCTKVIIMYKGIFVESGYTNEIFKTPIHPYTKLLFSLDFYKLEDSGFHRDENSCVFISLCKYAMEECRKIPKLKEVKKDHLARCHLV